MRKANKKILYLAANIVLLFFFSIGGAAFAAIPISTAEMGIPQDAFHYIKKNDHHLLLSRLQQDKYAQYYLTQFYSPWNTPIKAQSPSLRKIKENQEQDFNYYHAHPSWGENLRQHDATWLNDLRKNAHWKTFPNDFKLGIVINHGALRLFPTNKPVFSDPKLAGQGYPFDNAQMSEIAAGTPVQILHQSLNHDFYYVRSYIASGWISAKKIAFVNADFIKDWQHHPMMVFIQDNIPMLDSHDHHHFNAAIGQLFPMKSKDKAHYTLYIPIADEHQQAIMRTTAVPTSSVALFPMAMSPTSAATIINRLLKQAYGWGGYLNNRDCSATTRDYFSVFGIWLPRHSTAQLAKGKSTSLKAFNFKQRIELIREKGIPFLTLLGHPGHVMLYVGIDHQIPIVFHNKWGLHSFTQNGVEERSLIGYAALAPIDLGEKRKKTESLLSITEIMSNLNT